MHQPKGRRGGARADVPPAVMVIDTVPSQWPAPHASADAQQPAAESLRRIPLLRAHSAEPHALHGVM